MIRMLLFCVAAVWVLGAAPIAPPPEIRLTFSQDEIKVAETGTLSALEAPGVNNALASPSASSAARTARNDTSFRWIPSPLSGKVGVAADLRGAALSPDESLLVLLERIGGAGRPNSTRILLFNLCGNRLTGGFTVENMRLDTPFFLPEGDGVKLYAVRRGQKEFGNVSGIVCIDLKKGVIAEQLALPAEEISSIAAGGKKIFFCCAGKKEVCILDAGTLNAPVRTLTPQIKNPRVSASGKALVVYSGNEFQIFPLESGMPAGMPDPERFPGVEAASAVQMLEPDGSMLLIFNDSGTLWFRRGSSLRLLARNSTGFACGSLNDGMIYAPLKKKDLIQPYRLPELTEEKGYSPLKLKPLTKASLYAVFSLCGRKRTAAVVDEQGSVYTISFNGRRWHKTAVYLVDNSNQGI